MKIANIHLALVVGFVAFAVLLRCSYGSIGTVDQSHEIERLSKELKVEQKVNRELLVSHRKMMEDGKQQQQPPPAALPTATTFDLLNTRNLTVVLMSYPKSERFHRLVAIIEEVKSWNFVHEILIIWNGDADKVPEVVAAHVGPQMRILPQSHNRLDNRWKIAKQVKTDAILNMDDDINMKEKGGRCLFEIWKSAPFRITGIDVRSHSDNEYALEKSASRSGHKNKEWAYFPRHSDEYGRKAYSISLPRSLIGHKSIWEAYERAEPLLRPVVDDLLCDDIAFNFAAANATLAAPIYARAPFTPFPESQSANSLQKLKNMKAKRQKCLPALSDVFSGMVLKHNTWVAQCTWDGESGNHAKV
eukprot:TRINITY_DN18621_c0_g1_i1.p1 TRINITY_DN18621_c0_g1~~TRINITY_DN18621_c0_g1_i1.p1  ORF type:complete len:360 (+),score=65.10 TRINITY_DN18621_c0_g1_i1:25-1104(+)